MRGAEIQSPPKISCDFFGIPPNSEEPMTIEKIKELWKLLEKYGRWIALCLVTIDGIYYFGGFRALGSTGYFWYDLRRFSFWLYDSIIIPICLVYGARGLWRLILSLLPDNEENLPKYAQQLRHQGYRFEGPAIDFDADEIVAIFSLGQ